jgi:hypothetical protein
MTQRCFTVKKIINQIFFYSGKENINEEEYGEVN